MCREKNVLSWFKEVKPARSIEQQKEELQELEKKVMSSVLSGNLYKTAIISENDLVMPTKSQKAFWGGTDIKMIPGCHFPFTKWNSWEEILDL